MALRQKQIVAVSYYGSMRDSEKEEAHQKWQNDEVKVMVATRAFGLGINKKDIRLVFRHGLPPDLSAWVQEFGRAGRDGHKASCSILYSDEDIHDLSFWLQNINHQRKSEVAEAFSRALTFSYAHLAGECRREVVLEYFESDSLKEPNVDCCDVCAMEVMLLKNRKKELALVIKAIEELGKRGEKKIAQFIRGGNLAWIHEISDFNPQDPQSSYGKSPQELSLGWWCTFIRQAAVAGYLQKKVDCGTFQGRKASTFTYYEVSAKGVNGIGSKTDNVLLPDIPEESCLFYNTQSDSILRKDIPNHTGVQKGRKGSGFQPFNIVRNLLLEGTEIGFQCCRRNSTNTLGCTT